MAVKATIEKADLEALPEALRAEYVERNGKFVLNLEGAPDGFVPAAELADANGKVVEFRNTNIALKKEVDALTPIKTELDTLKQSFDGVDPAEYKTLKSELEKLQQKGVKNADDLDAKIQAAVSSALKPVTEQLTTVTGELTESKRRGVEQSVALARKDFETQVVTAAIKAGVDDRMMTHFVKHVTEMYQFEDGKFVPKQGAAPLISRKNGRDLMPLDEFIELQSTEAPGFFKKSQGGGTPPNPGGGAPPPNPGARKLVNPTPQQLGQHADAIRKGEMVVEYQRAAG